MDNIEQQLSADTQAILLLCGHFGKKTQGEIKPLTSSEYARLAQWLQVQDMRPADLLDTSSTVKIKHFSDKTITAGRLLALLMRGAALALAVEAWTHKGLWVISRSDTVYPMYLKKRLGQVAPPILYGVGQVTLLQKGGLAVVGSRDIDQSVIDFTKTVAKKSAQQSITIISGGARGVDTEALLTALIHGGTAVGVLADSLTRAAVASKYRDALREERLVLLSPFDPDTGFNVGNAMARNKYIYVLSDWAMVASSGYQEGGTWAGATENLKAQWVPLFVCKDEPIPTGNQHLLKQGGIGIDKHMLQNMDNLREQLSQLSETPIPQLTEIDEETEPENPPLPTKTVKVVGSGEKHTDLFEIVWPYIEQQLVTAKTEEELIKCLDLHSKQLKLWLKRALEMGKIKKLRKPVRYITIESTEFKEPSSGKQQSLFT